MARGGPWLQKLKMYFFTIHTCQQFQIFEKGQNLATDSSDFSKIMYFFDPIASAPWKRIWF